MRSSLVPIVVTLSVPAVILLAWALVVYRLELLMKATGVLLLVIGALMAIPVLDRLLAPLAVRIILWIGREIQENG